jgi:hypothetical protein
MNFKYLIVHTPNGERSVLFTNHPPPKLLIKRIGEPLNLQGCKLVSGGFCKITAQNIEGEKPWQFDCWGSLTRFGVESRPYLDPEIIEKDYEFSL